MNRALERAGQGLVLLLLPALLYSRAGAEIGIGAIGVLFLVRSAYCRDWGWLRQSEWVGFGLFWIWVMLCSAIGPGGGKSLLQAVLMARLPLLAAALGWWLLRDAKQRRLLAGMLGVTAAWIILECWQQTLFGVNINGFHRWGDGALTGPFHDPRAGPELILILFPAVLPFCLARIGRREILPRVLAVGAFALAMLTMVLIGQRMPALLCGLGLVLCGLVLPRLRRLAMGAALAAMLLVAATPVLSPPTFHKLVVHFSQQMEHFPQSDYGQLYIRATVMGLDHPWTGLGFDGFRDHCREARYVRGLPALGIPDRAAEGAGACNIHPHNHYLEALTEGGFPALVLFSAMVLVWCWRIGRRIGVADEERDGDAMQDRGAVQAGCLIGVVLAFWPLASTSALFTLPNAGWIFLILGLGLAAAGPQVEVPTAPGSAAPHRAKPA